MEEDDEMEVEQQVFDAYEIDVDYEFEAATFFDFTREESEAEAFLAQQWFMSAQSYPHSPFAEQMILREENLAEALSTSLREKGMENVNSQHDEELDVRMGSVSSAVDVNNNGTVKGIFTSIQNTQNMPSGLTTELTSNVKKPTKTLIGEKKSTVKPSFQRSSTLMKPTLSQLAKQTQRHQVGGSRFNVNREKSLCSSTGLESQAPKRQKLEGGQLRQVASKNPLTHLAHKAPKQDGIFERIQVHAKMKLTIPKEPVLETARRAYRIRAKSVKDMKQASSTVCPFKARPLNRKILEAPSLSFPKKNTPKLPEHQGGSDGHKSMAEDNIAETRRPSTREAGKQSGHNTVYTFRAPPGKTFASKGDQVAFRNSKRGTMAPTRSRHNPPIDLFSKLSLKPEVHPSNGSHLEVHRPISACQKDSKENRANLFQQNEEVRHSVKGKRPVFGGTWTQVCN